MKSAKLLHGIMAGSMAASMTVMPAFAAVEKTDAIIDPSKAVTLDVHKIIENSGANVEADGLENANETRIRVDDIGFSYKKVADIKAVTGKDANGKAIAGTYFSNVDAGFLTALGNPAGIVITDDSTSPATTATYYTAEILEAAMKAQLGTAAGTDALEGVAATGTQEFTGVKNGEHGVMSASHLSGQGLYLIAETDISAHDGLAGRLSDTAERKSQKYTVDTITGRIYDDRNSNSRDQATTHTYDYGEAYQESTNPEAPVIESKAQPFLVSLPTTNTTTVDDKTTGTVWQYDVDVYPKNQTTQIVKRIIDPDEKAGEETLRTHEDFQIGDSIEQTIFADIPVLQQNYLNHKDSDNDANGGAQVAGTVEDDNIGADTVNKHEQFVITDTMTKSLSFDEVTSVQIVTKPTGYGANAETNKLVYAGGMTDPNGKDGAVTYQRGYLPTSADEFVVAQTLVKDEDYTVAYDSTGTDSNSFTVTLTAAGLAKLDALQAESQIKVNFKSTLNKDAKIGEVAENQNYPSLTWRNTNQSQAKSINGNEVYAYCYELDLSKTGAKDASNVKFVIQRTDFGDIAQDTGKDLSTTAANGDGVKWVKEADGVYHVYDKRHEDSKDQADPNADTAAAAASTVGKIEVTEINGVKYYTVTPAKDGKLILKGFDSNKYTFKEIATEDENSLLKSVFDVTFKAPDDAAASRRNGTLVEDGTIITVDGESTTLNLHQDNLGIADLIVNNYDAIDLRTGGRGRTMIYAGAAAMFGAISAAAIIYKKRQQEED